MRDALPGVLFGLLMLGGGGGLGCTVIPNPLLVSDGEDTDTGETAPEEPVLGLGFSQVKQFDFSWAPALGAQYYRLLEHNVGDADYVQIGGGTSSGRRRR